MRFYILRFYILRLLWFEFKNHLHMLRILAAFSLSICLPFFVPAQQTQTQPYNVLFIAVDDLNCDINSYGNRAMHTPNLDRLARMGTQFNRAYCQFPWCSPSRTSVMTSLRPNRFQSEVLEGETIRIVFPPDSQATAREHWKRLPYP